MSPKEERETLYQRWEQVSQQLSSLEHLRGQLAPADYDARRKQIVSELDTIESRLRELWTEQKRSGS